MPAPHPTPPHPVHRGCRAGVRGTSEAGRVHAQVFRAQHTPSEGPMLAGPFSVHTVSFLSDNSPAGLGPDPQHAPSCFISGQRGRWTMERAQGAGWAGVYHPHCADGKTEVQRGARGCPGQRAVRGPKLTPLAWPLYPPGSKSAGLHGRGLGGAGRSWEAPPEPGGGSLAKPRAWL